MTQEGSNELQGRLRARFTITEESPPNVVAPPPHIPEYLLHGVFAHSVRTFTEGGIVMIDFSYNAPVDWHYGTGGSYSFEHVVVSRVLMPENDFREWIRKSAIALGVLQGE